MNFFSKSKKEKTRKISDELTIALLYNIPKSNKSKYSNWTDGFTKSINLIEDDFKISWINIEDKLPNNKELNTFDFIIAKCCWDSKLDIYLRSLKNLTTPIGIAISCSIIPSKKQASFYQVLWYETYWYKKLLPDHPCKIHAFGIASEDYQFKDEKKTIDVLSIGAITAYKRHEKLIEIEGLNKIVIGDNNFNDSDLITEKLFKNNIQVKNYTTSKQLAKLINQAKLVYIPAEINGGGERAVLEARSCKADVKTESDNPKLQELITSPIWDEKYYSIQLKKGIEKALNIIDNVFSTNRIESNIKIKVGRNSFHNGVFNISGDEIVEIGSFCSFGKNISIITSNHDTNYLSSQGYLYRKIFEADHPGEVNFPKSKERTKGPISIGNDVWIGDDVKIMSGVTIGNGACIGSGSIVTKDISPYEIHAGIPNKKIKNRFPDNIVTILLDIKWWNWSDKKIKRNKELFQTNLNSISTVQLKKIINL